MATSKPTKRSRWLLWGGSVAGAGLVLCFLPLFHVVPLKDARRQSAAVAFHASVFVEEFWNDRLLKNAPDAVDAGALLSVFRTDAKAAADRYGHRLGLSGNTSYFVSGSGRITSVNERSVEIALENGDTVVIKTGPVFGNAIRDGSGLLDVSDFANSRDFNAISSEINRRVEERIIPTLKEKAAVGTAIRFVGGVDIADSKTEISPLHLVPIVIKFP